MSEERPGTRQGFFSRVFAGPAEEGDGTVIYTPEEIGESVEPSRGFTVERAAEVIKNLPPEVPRPAAVRIVRGTLEAAGIDVEELASSTAERESRLNSEIELSRGRIHDLKESTEQMIRSFEEEIRKARETRNFGVAEEEKRISQAHGGLEDMAMVRDFFGLSLAGPVEGEDTEPVPGEETQVMEDRVDEDDTQVLRRPGPLSEEYRDGGEPR